MGATANHTKDAGNPGGDSSPTADASFDRVLEQLQDVVEQLERNDLPLERSLLAFEEGVALARRGQQMLDAAERRVDLLMRDDSTEPFEPTKDR